MSTTFEESSHEKEAKKIVVNDLRSALELLAQHENQLITTDEPVDPIAELSGVYRYVGAR